jgi:trk system potassium uptake protein TrkH
MTALSTTGFATVSYDAWNGFGGWLLICLMIIGGGAGSTAGGLKLFRVAVLLRSLVWQCRRWSLPPAAVTTPSIWQGEQRRFLDATDMAPLGLFLALYLLVLGVGTAILTAYGYPLQDSLFEFVSSLSTVGLSAGITSPEAPAGVLWVEIVGMVLGRLEFFPVIVGVMRLCQDGAVWLRL